MEVHKRMYYHLFNAISIALEHLAAGDGQGAQDILKQAQCHTEEEFLRRPELVKSRAKKFLQPPEE